MAQKEKEIDFEPDEIDFTPDVPETSTPVLATQTEDKRNPLRKGWDTLNTPLVTFPNREQMVEGMGGRETWPGYLADQGLSAVEGVSSPLGVMTGGPLMMGNPGKLVRGVNKAASGLNVVAGAEDIYKGEVGKGLGEIGLGALGLKGGRITKKVKPFESANEVKILPESINTPKPKMKLNPDGTFTNLNTGEILDKSGKPAQLKPNATVSPMFNPKGQKGKTGTIQGSVPLEVAPEGTKLSTIIVDKKGNTFTEIMNFPRAIQSSWDLSFPLRQGLGLVHKKAWWTSWNDMIRAYGSENAFRGSQEAIRQRPLFKNIIQEGKLIEPSYADKVGLQLTDLQDLSHREEQIMSTWAEKIPGVHRSNRAYTAFANQLRADTFEELINTAKKNGLDPENDLDLGNKIAKFVNSASGRGSLGSLEQNAQLLNSTLFSPRLIASRVNMIKQGLDPRNYTNAVNGDPKAQLLARESLKSIFSLTTAWTAMAGAAKLGGAEVSTNPTSSDFGKIKIGDTRLDPAGGLQQYLVLLARMSPLGGTTSSTSGKFTEFGSSAIAPTRLEAAGRFGLNKVSPWFGFLGELMGASKAYPTPVGDATIRMVMPMFIQDMLDIAQEDPSLVPFALPSLIGAGTQTYGEKTKRERKAPGMLGESDIQFEGGGAF